MRNSVNSGAYRELALWWLLSRVVVFGTALLVGATAWPHRVSEHGLGLLTGWDGHWYRQIASHGYHSGSGLRAVVFYPLLPAILAGLAAIHVPMTVSGLVVANACSAVCVAALYAFCLRWLDEGGARRAAVYVAIFPFSFVFSMAYPESLAFAAAVLACVAALSRRWTLSAVLGAVAGLARPQEALLVLPLGALAVGRWRRTGRAPIGVAMAAAAPVAAAAAFAGYLWWKVGDPHAWAHAERGWGRGFSFAGPADALRQVVNAPYGTLFTPPFAVLWLLREVVFVAVYAALLLLAARTRLPRIWILYGLVVVGLPLFGGSFTSTGREGLLALPFFAGFAVVQRPALDRALRAGSLVLLAAFVVSLAYRYP